MFRHNRLTYTIAAAALVMTPPSARSQETVPVEPVPTREEAASSEGVEILAPLSDVSFAEEVDLSTVSYRDLRIAEPTSEPEQLTSAPEQEEGYSSDDVVVTATQRAPINVDVPEQFTENEFNATLVEIYDTFSLRGDAWTLRPGDGGNIFQFEYRFNDNDQTPNSYQYRRETELDEEQHWERR